MKEHVSNYPDSSKSKLIPLCRTRWVERINSLEVTLDLMNAVSETLMEMHENADKSWNRGTSTQGFSLLKSIDFEFIVTLVVTQRVIAFTSGITTGLQTRGIDLANVVEQVKFVIRALQAAKDKIESFHNECFQYACDKAKCIDVDIKKPHTCKRQTNHLNAVSLSHSTLEESMIEQYFQVNLTIPFLDEVIGNLHSRFPEGQDTVPQGVLLIPPYVVTHESWEQSVDPFLQYCIDELPCSHTISAELAMWKMLWIDNWEQQWKIIKDQHLKATGSDINLTNTEVKKLKFTSLPSDVASTLKETDKDLFPNITYLLCLWCSTIDNM